MHISHMKSKPVSTLRTLRFLMNSRDFIPLRSRYHWTLKQLDVRLRVLVWRILLTEPSASTYATTKAIDSLLKRKRRFGLSYRKHSNHYQSLHRMESLTRTIVGLNRSSSSTVLSTPCLHITPYSRNFPIV